jgi:D-inositol-3-phosphate glycosyltransferase
MLGDMGHMQRLALISVHASPLEPMGGKKTGGMNVYIRNLAQEFGRRGLNVDIFTRHTGAETAQVDTSLGENVRVIYIEAGGSRSLSPDDVFPHLSEFTAGIIAFASQRNLAYDLIFSHYWLSGWVANCLKIVWGVPFVQMFHTLGQMKNRVASGGSSPHQRIQIEMKVVEWADHIIAATPAESVQLRWLYRANRRKISIISPGVDLNQFYPVAGSLARSRLGIPAEIPVFLFVGRLEPLKGVDTILEALVVIRIWRPEIFHSMRFIVVGGSDPTDTERLKLTHLVDELGLDANVQFAGAKSQAQLLDYYAAANAVLMPSDYESFGMVALEAMASGTPVIASNIGGLAFLVKDGITGYLVPTRDPDSLAHRMIEIVERPAQSMRLSALTLARQYMWSLRADDLLKLFQRIISRRMHSEYR